MAAAMAAKINAMLMAKGKLLTPPPLLAKVHLNFNTTEYFICCNAVIHFFLVFPCLLDTSNCASAHYCRGDGGHRG